MKNKRKIVNLIIFNLIIIISTISYSIMGVCFGAGEGQLGEGIIGIGYFKPFTIDSNVFMCIVAIIYVIFLIRKLITKKDIPNIVNIFYYVGVVCISLTFLTVVFFLSPMAYFEHGLIKALAFFCDDMFFYHFVNPILACVCFFIMTENKKIGIKENLFSIIPMAIYSVVYLINVAILKTWEDFYGFTFGGKYYLIPVVIIVMFSITYLIGFILRKLKNRTKK